MVIYDPFGEGIWKDNRVKGEKANLSSARHIKNLHMVFPPPGSLQKDIPTES
jgi:hypothetical protein